MNNLKMGCILFLTFFSWNEVRAEEAKKISSQDLARCLTDQECIAVKFHHCCGSQSWKAINRKYLTQYYQSWSNNFKDPICALIGQCLDKQLPAKPSLSCIKNTCSILITNR